MSIETCATPKCEGTPIEGRNFCEPCAVRLDRIKAEIDGDPRLTWNQKQDNRGKYGVMATNNKMVIAKKKSVPTCTMFGCNEDRIPPSIYCHVHEDEPEEAFPQM